MQGESNQIRHIKLIDSLMSFNKKRPYPSLPLQRRQSDDEMGRGRGMELRGARIMMHMNLWNLEILKI